MGKTLHDCDRLNYYDAVINCKVPASSVSRATFYKTRACRFKTGYMQFVSFIIIIILNCCKVDYQLFVLNKDIKQISQLSRIESCSGDGRIIPRGIYCRSPLFNAFSRTVMVEKSMSPLFSVGVCVVGWGGGRGYKVHNCAMVKLVFKKQWSNRTFNKRQM